MSEDQKKRYRFHDHETHGLELANHYHYTGQGGAPSLREFTDEAGLKYTLKAMKALGWDDAKTDTVLALCAGLLHLGQVNFDGVEGEGGEIAVVRDVKEVEDAAHLLGVDKEKLKIALTERIMITRGDEIKIQLTPAKASDSRDALAKTIYGALFLWVVEEVNHCICWENDSEVRSSSGVLDIFGFECFAVNSFEQLCINFTNEALQQQFNKFIFKMEQTEYENESINWAFIEFPDNQDCLDTIQSRPTGILAMLDDECKLGQRGNDRNWANRLYKHFLPEKKQTESDNTRFLATPVQRSRSIFCVRHFAGVVQYTATTGFLEKNKDEIPVTAKNLLESAPSQLVKDLFDVQKKAIEEAQPAAKPGARGGKPAKSKTVGQQFKEQLSDLMAKIETTDPHYIRCLKPNDAAKPKMMTRKRLTEQLRYGGVLEAVRVARMGYPVRMDHVGFFQRYRVLLPSVSEETLSFSIDDHPTPQDLCIKLVDILLEEGAKARKLGAVSPDEPGITRNEQVRRQQRQPPPMMFPKSDVQLGLSKVFMRKPPHDALEAHRVFHQTAASTVLQAWTRGLQENMRYLVLLHAAETAQRWYRGCKGRDRWWKLRKEVAAQLLSNHFHMQVYRRKYQRGRRGTIKFQGVARGHAMRRVLATIRIQTTQRRTKLRYNYKRLKSATVALQCALRSRRARHHLRELKKEQGDIGKLRENNEKLKQEMASLKAMLSAQAQNDASKAIHQQEIEEKEKEIASLEKRISKLEKDLEKEKENAKKLEEDMAKQKEEAEKRLLEVQKLQKQAAERQHYVPPSSAAARQSSTRSLNASGPGAEPVARDAPPSPTRRATVTIEQALQQRKEDAVAAAAAAAIDISGLELVPGGVDPAKLASQRALVAKLEEELESERKMRNEADREIMRLRKLAGGKALSGEADDMLSPLKSDMGVSMEAVVEDDGGSVAQGAGEEQLSEINGSLGPAPDAVDRAQKQAAMSKTSSLSQLEAQRRMVEEKAREVEKARPVVQRSASDYFPLIRRGFAGVGEEAGKQEEQVVAVGWKVEITNRKEREESLRDEVHQFESKMRRCYPSLEEGVEVTMWELNRNMELGPEESRDEFGLKATAVHVKLHRRGDLLVQSVLAFATKGGYLSKALGRRRHDKTALEPLPVHEILEVKAGCVGYDQADLPAASSARSKGKSRSSENRHSSMFLTLKATQTPMASSRFYFFKFKSRSARNDLMTGLRGLLADLQIQEGVSVSQLQDPMSNHPSWGGQNRRNQPQAVEMSPMENGDVMAPLSEVAKVIDREREAYDRLLLLLLQGSSDLKEKEDELLMLRGKLDAVSAESAEKDRVQANDSKLIMQLSKKLETLLMDNEDLRDQNDRLNTRLVAVECEKMNLMST